MRAWSEGKGGDGGQRAVTAAKPEGNAVRARVGNGYVEIAVSTKIGYRNA